LTVELRNLRDVASRVTIRVHDRQHNLAHDDRYSQAFELPPRSAQALRIPLDHIRLAPRGRQMDMTAIRGLILYQDAPNRLPDFSVSEIRLER
jgi:hypothetical protein